VESVRCLECGEVYSKPSGGGTAIANPGCPRCGYVGWISTRVPLNAGFVPRRFVVDPLPRPSAQSS
jgi:phage FluMu protein Com